MPHSMQQKQPTWNTKSRARITNSDELRPVPQRAHRRDEYNLRLRAGDEKAGKKVAKKSAWKTEPNKMGNNERMGDTAEEKVSARDYGEMEWCARCAGFLKEEPAGGGGRVRTGWTEAERAGGRRQCKGRGSPKEWVSKKRRAAEHDEKRNAAHNAIFSGMMCECKKQEPIPSHTLARRIRRIARHKIQIKERIKCWQYKAKKEHTEHRNCIDSAQRTLAAQCSTNRSNRTRSTIPNVQKAFFVVVVVVGSYVCIYCSEDDFYNVLGAPYLCLALSLECKPMCNNVCSLTHTCNVQIKCKRIKFEQKQK